MRLGPMPLFAFTVTPADASRPRRAAEAAALRKTHRAMLPLHALVIAAAAALTAHWAPVLGAWPLLTLLALPLVRLVTPRDERPGRPRRAIRLDLDQRAARSSGLLD